MKIAKWQETPAGFLEYITKTNALQESFISSLLPITHKTCAVLLASKCVRVLKLLEFGDVESFKESEALTSLEKFIGLFCTTFKPKFCYFEINKADSPDFATIKKLANQMLTDEMLK